MIPSSYTPHASEPPAACRPFAGQLPLIAARLLTDHQYARLLAHVASCPRCTAELAQHDRINAGLAQMTQARQHEMTPFTANEIAQVADAFAPGVQHSLPHLAALHASRRPEQRGALARVAPYVAVAAIIVLALGLLGVPGLAQRSVRGGGDTGTITKDIQLTGIAMLATGTGWATGNDANNHPAIFHYAGSRWSAVALPIGVPVHATLNSLAMVSDTDGWAVGGVSAGVSSGNESSAAPRAPGDPSAATSLLLHASENRWSVEPVTFPSELTRVFMLNTNDGWAVGTSLDGQGMLLHYDGTTWRRVLSPVFTNMQLNGVSAVAADDVWITARLPDESSAILHFDGTRWSRQAGLDLSEAALSSIQMISTTEGWAVGGYCSCAHTLDVPTRKLSGALILHYHAGVWTFQTSTLPDYNRVSLGDYLFDIAMVSSTDGWAVGAGSTLLHYSLGSWSPAASPSHLPPGATRVSPSLLSISMVSPTQGWTAGDQGTLLRYSNGDWESA